MESTGRASAVPSSAVQRLADQWSAALVSDLGRPRTTSRAFTLSGSGDGVGSLTVIDGTVGEAGVPLRVVDTRLVVPHLQIDSVMLHAFSPASSTSPHLLSDLAQLTTDGRTEWHFHVDLMPRIDLVATPGSIDPIYGPLTRSYEAVHAIEGMRPITIPPRLRALSSAWLIGAIVTPGDEAAIDAVFTDYAQRWSLLVQEPPAPPTGWDSRGQAERDRAHRSAVFDPSTDIVWEVLADLIGQDDVDAVLAAAKGED